MKNKQQKIELIERGIPKDFGIRKYDLYNATGGDFEAVEQQLKNIYQEDYEALKQLAKARKEQNSKVKKHLTYLINQPGIKIYFCTFTYSDLWKENPTPEQLKRQVIRALKNAEDFIINIDYGKETDRMHYHAIAAYKENIDIKEDKPKDKYERKVGYTAFKEIKKDETDIKRLTYYLNKLTMHSIKVKQKYISTRKGSKYQILKNEYKRQKNQGFISYSRQVEKFIEQTEEIKEKQV